MNTPQGDRFDITLLRPIGWLESCNAQVGSSIHLVVSEQGLDGLADVLAIEPCPRISSGVGRVVTGTFTHVRGGILRIKLAGLAEPLGVTSNHSIYSSDRLDFVILEGAEYEASRKAANQVNQAIRRADPEAAIGKEIHEIHPVKFGGSPTDPVNKIRLPSNEHRQHVTPWWNKLLRAMQGNSGE